MTALILIRTLCFFVFCFLFFYFLERSQSQSVNHVSRHFIWLEQCLRTKQDHGGLIVYANLLTTILQYQRWPHAQWPQNTPRFVQCSFSLLKAQLIGRQLATAEEKKRKLVDDLGSNAAQKLTKGKPPESNALNIRVLSNPSSYPI